MNLFSKSSAKNEQKNNNTSDLQNENQRKLVCKTIGLELIESVEEGLKEKNIYYEIEKNGTIAKLFVEPFQREIVSAIEQQCRSNYQNKLISEAEKNQNENLSVDQKINNAKENKAVKEEVEVIEIVPEVRDELDYILTSNDVWHVFQNIDAKTIKMYFHVPDSQFVYENYLELIKPIANSKPENEFENKENKKSNRKTLGRYVRYQLRFTPEEWQIVEERVKKSGKKKGDFGREMFLNGHVKVITPKGLAVLDELESIHSQLGKLGGLLAKIMSNTKESGTLSEGEKEELKAVKKEIKALKSEVKRTVKDIWH